MRWSGNVAVSNFSDANYITRASGLSNSSGWTLCAWFWLDVLPSASTMLEHQHTSGSDLDVSIASSSLTLWNGSATTTATNVFAVKTWYHVALTGSAVTSGSSLVGYINGVSKVTASSAGNPAATTTFWVGRDFGTGQALGAGCRMANLKVFSAQLSAAQIVQEYRSYAPVNRASLNAWMPLSDTKLLATDIGSGAKRNFTWTGTGLRGAPEPPYSTQGYRRPAAPQRAAFPVAGGGPTAAQKAGFFF